MNDWQTPKDEIPGITTFLYEANRFREPHEYINSWKWEQKCDARLSRLGLPDNAQTEELLDRIQDLQYKLEEADMTPELRRLNQDIEQLQHELEAIRKVAADFKSKSEKASTEALASSMSMEKEKAAAKLFREKLIKYGEHHPDCNVVDALESGRMLDRTEKEACTCGWSSDKLQALEVE